MGNTLEKLWGIRGKKPALKGPMHKFTHFRKQSKITRKRGAQSFLKRTNLIGSGHILVRGEPSSGNETGMLTHIPADAIEVLLLAC